MISQISRWIWEEVKAARDDRANMRTRREAGFAREVQEGGNRWAEDIGVEDTAATALSGESEGKVDCFEDS